MPKGRVIYKYELPAPANHFEIEAQVGAQWLHVDVQSGRPYLWALVDPTADTELYKFRWAGTGQSIGDDVGEYVGTFMMLEGALVWHIFKMR